MVEIPHDLHVVGDEPDGHEHRRGVPFGGQVPQMVVDVRLEPGHGGRTRPALVHEVMAHRRVDPLPHEIGDGAELDLVVAGVGLRTRDGVGGEDEGSGCARRTQLVSGGSGGVHERSHEPGMVEEGTELVDLGRPLADRGPGPVDVVEVLPAARIGAVGGGDERKCAADPVVGHTRHRVGQERVPVAVAPVDGQVGPAGGERLLEP